MQSLSDVICDYINREWIKKWKGSIRAFANEYDVDEKTVRRIVNSKNDPYSISLYTLEKMCTAQKITLEQFFGLIKR